MAQKIANGRRGVIESAPGGGVMGQTGIKKRNGRYRARYFAGFDSKGKRRYPSRTFDRLSDAIKWRASQVNAKTGGRVEGHNLTVRQYFDSWLEIKKQSLRENSWDMYRSFLIDYAAPRIGHIKLSRLLPTHIEQMQSSMLSSGLSPSTVLSTRIIANGALKKAVRLGLIQANPISSTDGPRRPKPKRYPLSVEESLRLVAACESMRLGLAFHLMLATGLRPEELIGLQWADLELGERGVVHVRHVIHKLRGGGWRWHEPKTKNGVRSVVFPRDLVVKLLEHRREQLTQKLKIGRSWQNNDLVFPTKLGTPLLNCALQAPFKAITQSAGIPSEVRLYDLRHSFVTLSLVAGVDLKTVSDEAGHATASFTADHYGSVLKEMHDSASDKREQLLKERTVRKGKFDRWLN